MKHFWSLAFFLALIFFGNYAFAANGSGLGDTIDRVIQISGPLLGLLGLGGLILQLRNQWKQKFFDHQIEIYRATSEVVAEIAVASKGEDIEKSKSARKKFYMLYWGQMCLVESPEVESAMIEFAEKLEEGKTQELPELSYYLIHQLRASNLNRYFWKGSRIRGKRDKKNLPGKI